MLRRASKKEKNMIKEVLLVNMIKFQGWMYYSVTKTTTKKSAARPCLSFQKPLEKQKKEFKSTVRFARPSFQKPCKKKEVPQKSQKRWLAKAQV